MAAPLQASMPQLLDIGAGYVLRVTALDPTTGNAVAGVQIGTVTITSAPASDVFQLPSLGPKPIMIRQKIA